MTFPAGNVLADTDAGELANVALLSTSSRLDSNGFGAPDLKDATIGEIRIVSGNIFDLNIPEESHRLHRWANSLHIKTRPEVIRTQLLFEPGEHFNAQLVEESARLLRSNRYLQDAEIVPAAYKNGVVDLEVRTNDVWTLSPSISFSRGGGKNSGGFGIKEYNLLGSGSSVGLGYKSDIDRNKTTLRYPNRNLLHSRYQLLADYSAATDGFTQNFKLEQPFFALDTRRSRGFSFSNTRQTEALYDRGNIVSRFEHEFRQGAMFLGWSKGLQGNWTRRYTAGLAYESHRYHAAPDESYPTPELQADRELAFPFVGVEILQNEFATTRNFDQMNRKEDRHLGKQLVFRLGYANSGLGSSDNAWLFTGHYSDSLLRREDRTLLFSADLNGRLVNGAGENIKTTLGARYDHRQSAKRLFHASASASIGHNLDIDNPVYIGGDNGLRGYPLRYQGGDKSFMLTLEQRYFTDWYPFHMFNVGGAVFFDAGRTWGSDPANSENLGWLRDVGLGLRIGNTRSGIGRMIHIDLAYPLDGESGISNLQLLVEAKRSF